METQKRPQNFHSGGRFLYALIYAVLDDFGHWIYIHAPKLDDFRDDDSPQTQTECGFAGFPYPMTKLYKMVILYNNAII